MFIRNKKILRGISLFFLITFLNSVFFPTFSYALAGGPSQPEFNDYEEVASTDMVDLISGDFTYGIPVMEIPGTEGSFSFPLAYHSGIPLESDASWVGLGWSLNPGAITRSSGQYPDDFAGESLVTVANDPGGVNYSINALVFTYDHNAQKGNGGSIGLQGLLAVGYGTHTGDFSLLGLVVEDGKARVDWVSLTIAALTIASEGLDGIAAAAAEGSAEAAAYSDAASITREALGVVDDFNRYYMLANIGAAAANGELSYSNITHADWSVKQQNYIVYQSQKYWLDAVKTEHMYGSLYYGLMNRQTLGESWPFFSSLSKSDAASACSDPYMWMSATNDAFYHGDVSDMYMNVNDPVMGVVTEPTNITNDNYSVKGPGVSGNMAPYHYETGNLSFYRALASSEFYYAGYPYLAPVANNYQNKVKYRYLGDYSNYYNYHSYNNGGDQTGITLCKDAGPTYAIYDPALSDINKRVQPDRRGFKSGKLIQGRNIEWYSNEEITNNAPGEFIDFLSSTAQNGEVARTTFRQALPQKGIGGYAVTRTDGTTFYYALPVYTSLQYTYGYNASNSAKNNSSAIDAPYAYQWLLTGVTGPDFVDRGEIGVLDEEDWGYWAKLEYGKFSNAHTWRTPYKWRTAADHLAELISADGGARLYSTGKKETYYLDKISTRTHTAVFIKDLRNDGKSNDNPASSSLLLKEIALLTKEDYKTLTGTTYNFTKATSNSNTNIGNGDDWTRVFDEADISSTVISPATISQRAFIDQNVIKKIVFNYSYDLCQGTPNSFPTKVPPLVTSGGFTYIPNGTGKLTLTSLNAYGPNNAAMHPPYVFQYNGANPIYHPDKWDGWGMYKSDGSYSETGHTANPTDGLAWNLTDIITPMGSTISLTYERDDYASVSGFAPSVYSTLNFNQPCPNSDCTVMPDLTLIGNQALIDQVQPGLSVSLYLSSPNSPEFTGTFTVASKNGNSIQLVNPPGCYLCPGTAYVGTITFLQTKVYGGNVRISQIRVSDGVNTYKTNYIYTLDGTPTGGSSGVVAQEPDFIKNQTYAMDALGKRVNDYPYTPVMYKKVTVYSGKLDTWNDFTAGKEYIFTTPDFNSNLVTISCNSALPNWTSFNYGQSMVGDMFVTHADGQSYYHYKLYNNQVTVNTSKIGSIESIKTFDNTNLVTSKYVFNYSSSGPSEPNQGTFTQGSLLAESCIDATGYYNKMVRTTKTYLPNFLSSIVTTVGNNTSTVTNTALDLYTGGVLEKRFTNSLGVSYTSLDLPAYQVYPEMGSKAESPSYKNMMSQNAASYLSIYKNGVIAEVKPVNIVATGNPNEYTITITSNNPTPYEYTNIFPFNYGVDFGPMVSIQGFSTSVKPTYIAPDRKSIKVVTTQAIAGSRNLNIYNYDLVSASIQTWDNNWNFRKYDSGLNMYYDSPITDYASIGVTTTSAQSPKINRKKAVYAWKSPRLNQNGSYMYYMDFDWSGANIHNNWQKASEMKNYDQFTKPLEMMDINGNYASTKRGYDLKFPVISGANAMYCELAYSGAEDQNSSIVYGDLNHFGSEVDKGTGTTDPLAHTGTASLKLTTGQSGFTYKSKRATNGVAGIGTDGMIPNKKYRASVWVYGDPANPNPTANLYYKLQDASGADITTPYQGSVNASNAVIKIGNWILLNLDFTIGSEAIYNNYLVVIGCTNPNSLPAYFDDFRVHPLSTTVTTSVYDKQRGFVTYTLDKDNFFTRYQYDAQGRVTDVYKETKNGVVKFKHYDYNFGRGN